MIAMHEHYSHVAALQVGNPCMQAACLQTASKSTGWLRTITTHAARTRGIFLSLTVLYSSTQTLAQVYNHLLYTGSTLYSEWV